jgi:hypothetical protein
LLIQILATEATFVPNVLNLILCTKLPFVPALKQRKFVPAANVLVVFAVVADIAHCISGVSVKIGDVFAAILFLFY